MNEARQKRQRAEKIGRQSEWLGALYLRLAGYRILAQRYKAHSGEVDIIARRKSLIAFIEVKARAQLDDAITAVSPKARRRIGAAASMYIAENPHLAASDMRYDIMAVSGWRIQHLRNAWREGD